MAMEERSYLRSSGGVREQQLSDMEINDMEHPQFVNSSISDDEELGENNNVASSSYSVPDSRQLFPIPFRSVVVPPPTIRGPPASSSASCFVTNVLRSVQETNNNVKTTQDVAVSMQSIQKTFKKINSDGQREVLEKLQRSNEKRSELIKLKESINSLQIQKKTLEEEYTGVVTRCAKRGQVSKLKLAQAESTYKKGEDRLKDKTDARNSLKEKLKHVKRKLEEVSNEDAELSEWTSEHGIIVHMKLKSSSNGPENEREDVVIEVLNVNPLKPEDRFHILAESVSLHRFCIGNIFPDFEEAFDVLERANESQDLIQLLRDCKKYWKRDCQRASRLSDKLCESTKGQTMISDQTMELFESPP